jgi:secreted Zn-dependent insulinase-like peptidase
LAVLLISYTPFSIPIDYL